MPRVPVELEGAVAGATRRAAGVAPRIVLVASMLPPGVPTDAIPPVAVAALTLNVAFTARMLESPKAATPPPPSPASLPLTMAFISVTVATCAAIPPPYSPALFP